MRRPLLARLAGGGRIGPALEFVRFGSAVVDEAGPQGLGITYWFDAPDTDETYDVVLRLTGRRLDLDGPRTPADEFVAETRLTGLPPRAGRTSLTHRVHDKAAGRWQVHADAEAIPSGGASGARKRLPHAEGVGRSTLALVAGARAPGVVLGAWPALVALGAVLGVSLQAALAPAYGLPRGPLLVLSLVASLVGLVGARLYYRLTHRHEQAVTWLSGLSVQGFVLGAAAILALGAGVLGGSIGSVLDVTVPALLLGQAVGRQGCLLGGCCVGVPSRSRWAVWSSDRRVGTRRVPVQLMESVSAAALAAVAAVVAWQVQPTPRGVLFVGGFGAYVLVRQLLFPLRALPRATSYGRTASLVGAGVAVVGAVALGFLG